MTLDNAKFAYLMFYYGFLSKCIDMDRIHVIEGDTDSIYFAVAGDPTKSIHQGFRYVVRNTAQAKAFYHKHFYEWFPDPWEGKENEKKLGGVAVENEGDQLIAVAPKNYTISTNGKDKLKAKGCSLERNSQITAKDYLNSIENNTSINAENCGFHIKNDIFVKDLVDKVCISGIHTKMIVLENECSAPYVYGLTAKDYCVE
jgi:beta-galactosidase GanA